MPSVMTIAGAEPPDGRDKRKKKPTRCKWVTNPRTRREQKLCYLGRTKNRPTGWAFVKGARR